IEASYCQLEAAEQRCFDGLAIFRGGFTIDAAESVVGAVLSQIEALVARSLLRVEASSDSRTRLSLYETIRAYAAERFADRGAWRETVADAHARCFAELGVALVHRASSSSDAFARRRLEAEHDNLVVAHAHAIGVAKRDPTSDAARWALCLACAIDALLVPRGLPSVRLGFLDAALDAGARATADVDTVRVEALLARARAHCDVGAFEAARVDLDRVIALAPAVDRVDLAALAHVRLGELGELSGATATARARIEAGLACLASLAPDARALPRFARVEAEAFARLGHAHRREGALDAAASSIDRALALHRRLGGGEGLAWVLYEAATIALFRERYDDACGWFEEGLTLARDAGARHAEAALTTAMGTMHLDRGDTDAALDCHLRGARLFRDAGNRYREASARYYLGRTYLLRGQRDEATTVLETALDVVRAAGVPRYEALIEGCVATLHADAGRHAAALVSLAAADRACLAYASEPTLRATLEIHRLHVALSAAREADHAAIVARAHAIAIADGFACDDPRFALRWLDRRAEAFVGAPRAIVRVARDGARVYVPGVDAPIDLSRRAPLRRIVAALAEKRVAAPGDGLRVDDLVACGWPGERMGEAAAANRVYVALATLRALGLRRVLVSGDGGYAFSTAFAITFEPSDPAI
ncbi:MAG: hypothetical protein ACHREM_27040, partial [Polyangiales bacterium]